MNHVKSGRRTFQKEKTIGENTLREGPPELGRQKGSAKEAQGSE